MNSLKGRLFLILVAATSLIWLAATCWIYVGATREVESVLDARLQEAARMVLSLASGNGVGATLKDGDSAPAPEIMSYERQLSCQIWSLDGRLVARSSGAPDESLSDKRAGFSERLIKGETWRVYTAEDAAKGVRVSVGDRLGLRAHLVGEIIKGLLAPLLLAIPLLGLLIWASLNRGLRPLQALARELGRRNADDMSPVETGTIPAEIRPVVASLNHLFRKVRDAMQHERELTAFAAHELRTPLAGLRTQAQIAMVAGDGSGSRGRAAPDRRRRRSDHPDGPPVAGDGKARFHHEAKQSSVNIGDVIEEVIDALPASDRKAEVGLDPALKGTMVTANRELLLVAIRNLHENAVRHMRRAGHYQMVDGARRRHIDCLSSMTRARAFRKTRLRWSQTDFSAAATRARSEADSDCRSSNSRCAPAAPGWSCKTGAMRAACARKSFGRSRKTVKCTPREGYAVGPLQTVRGRVSRRRNSHAH